MIHIESVISPHIATSEILQNSKKNIQKFKNIKIPKIIFKMFQNLKKKNFYKKGNFSRFLNTVPQIFPPVVG